MNELTHSIATKLDWGLIFQQKLSHVQALLIRVVTYMWYIGKPYLTTPKGEI